MMTTTPDTTLVTYSCPHCGAGLEARAAQPFPWLKCPKCKRATAPPEPTTRARGTFQPFVVGVEEDVLVIEAENPYSPRSVTLPPQTRPTSPFPLNAPLRPTGREAGLTGGPLAKDAFGGGEPVSIRRVILTTVLFISVMMGLFGFLAGNSTGSSLAGASALICLILLVIPTRS